MADSDKNILITPQISQVTDPSIVFSSGATGGDDITLFVTDDGTISTISFEGSSGQLFSISNDLTGVIFSVNDISGIPSLEVHADGTVSIAEFDGEVGIGTSAPTEMLTIQGRDVASSNTGIRINSRGDAYVKLIADTDSDTEDENPYVSFSQDAAAVTAVIGLTNTSKDPEGNTFTGMATNSLAIHHKWAGGTISLGVNGQVGLTIDDSDVVTATTFSGALSGNATTATTATNATNVNVLQSTASASRPFVFALNTTAGNKVLYTDSAATCFINPTSNVIGATAFISTGDMTADNFEATGLGPNSSPGTDDAYFGGYGMLGSRAAMYISNNAGSISLNYSALHGSGIKLVTTSTGVRITDSLFLDEQAAANTDVGGDGQIWVRTRTPNDLYFTTDNGIDYPVGYATYRRLTETTLDNINVAETIGQQHMNGVWVKSTTTARILTLETSSGFNFKVGSQLSIYNRSTSGNMTVNDTSTQTLWYLDGSTAVDSVGGVVIGPGGFATLIRESASICVIMGAGIT